MSRTRPSQLLSLLRNHETEAAIDLIKRQPNANKLNEKNEDGYTLLELAARDGKTELVQWLIYAGAEIDHTEDKTEIAPSALYLAAKNQHIDIATKLLACGADQAKAIKIARENKEEVLQKVIADLNITPTLIRGLFYWAIANFHEEYDLTLLNRLQVHLFQMTTNKKGRWQTLKPEWIDDVSAWLTFATQLDCMPIINKLKTLLPKFEPIENKSVGTLSDILIHKEWFVLYTTLMDEHPENLVFHELKKDNSDLIHFLLTAIPICPIEIIDLIKTEELQEQFIRKYVNIGSLLQKIISCNLQKMMTPLEANVFSVLSYYTNDIPKIVSSCVRDQPFLSGTLFCSQFGIMPAKKKIIQDATFPGNIGADIWKEILTSYLKTDEKLLIKTVSKSFAKLLVPETYFLKLTLKENERTLKILKDYRALIQQVQVGCCKHLGPWPSKCTSIPLLLLGGLTTLISIAEFIILPFLVDTQDNILKSPPHEWCFKFRTPDSYFHQPWLWFDFTCTGGDLSYQPEECQIACNTLLTYQEWHRVLSTSVMVTGMLFLIFLIWFINHLIDETCRPGRLNNLKPSEDFSDELADATKRLYSQRLLTDTQLTLAETKNEINDAITTRKSISKQTEEKLNSSLRFFNHLAPAERAASAIKNLPDSKRMFESKRTPALVINSATLHYLDEENEMPRQSCCNKISAWFKSFRR